MLIQELSQVQNKQQTTKTKHGSGHLLEWSTLQKKKKKKKKKMHQETESDLTDFKGVHLSAALL